MYERFISIKTVGVNSAEANLFLFCLTKFPGQNNWKREAENRFSDFYTLISDAATLCDSKEDDVTQMPGNAFN